MNNNIIKALSCLIGSNCLVSTPEAFYIGERGWQSETIRIKALEEKTDMMQVDIEILRSDRDEILGRLSTTENTAINAQSLGESNFESIQIIQGILVEVEQRSKNNSSNIDQLIANTDNNTAEIDGIKMTIQETTPVTILLDSTVQDNITQGNIKYGEEHKVVDAGGVIHGTFIMYAQNSNVVYGFKTTGEVSIVRASDTEFAITNDSLGDKYYTPDGNPY